MCWVKISAIIKNIHRNRFHLVLVFSSVFFQNCIEPYAPPVQSDSGYLVIDGFLNSGSDSTIIKLTRTQTLDATAAPHAVTGALVQVQDDQKNIITLKDYKNSGQYSLYGASLPADRTYRLYIKVGGKEYISEYVPVTKTPPIDSVFWDLETQDGAKGLQLYINTHSPEKNGSYYHWEYTETWEYHAMYQSNFEIVGQTIFRRPSYRQVYACWQNYVAPNVLIYTTTPLSEDIVDRFPLKFCRLTSYRFSVRYSLLVNQYTLTKDAYAYWQAIKKDSENTGGIFGPLPSQTNGNITCVTNSSEPVIGYFTFTNKQSKRIWISPYDLPAVGIYDEAPNDSCLVKTIPSDVIKDFTYFTFLDGHLDDEGKPYGPFNYTDPICADCTLLGGKTIKPGFW